jgi:rhamnosyltransferase subunit B
VQRSKKIVLATFGTLGDIYPFIAIALALKMRGFTPVIAAPEMHKRAVEGEGVAYAHLRPHEADIATALGVDIPGAFRIMLKNPHFILDEIYMRFLAETYEDVMRACVGAELIITHNLLVGANLAAEKLGLPCARVALAPLYLQSAAFPSLTPAAPYILQPKSRAAMQYNRALRAIIRISVNVRMGRFRGFRKKIGLPSTNEDFFLDFGRENKAKIVFGLFSPHFAPPQPDHPRNLCVPGFPFYKPRDSERRELNPDLQRFLFNGEPPVIFTLGSFAPEVSGEFYDHSIRAVRRLGRRAILLAGAKDAARLGSLISTNEYVCEHAPHSLLFQKGLCIVHHGGVGTTAEALRAGKPQLVVPFFGDQPDQATRIERLGLGCTINLSDYREHSAALALQELVAGDYAEKALAFSKHIELEKGVEAVADWVERMP